MRKFAASMGLAIVMALIVALMPLAVMAQVDGLDEASRATVVRVAQRTAMVVDADVVVPESATLVPELEDEEPTEEPTDEVVTLPELNLADVAEYSSGGLTIRAPADWIVEEGFSPDTLFLIEVPGTEVFASVEADSDLGFPSWLGVALFRSQSELLTQQMGDEFELTESGLLYTPQGLPIAKIGMAGMEFGEEFMGALHVTAPNETAYLVVGGGPADEWMYAEPGMQLIVESMTFDDDLVTVEQAGDAPYLFADGESGIEVTVPAQWYVMASGDGQFPVIAAEPEARYVAAIGNAETFAGEFDPEILRVFVPDADLDASESEELLDEIFDVIADSGTPIVPDEEASLVLPREGAVTIKIVGEAELDDGLMMPMVFYIDLRQEDVGVVVIFGDTESALEIEDELQVMLESVVTVEDASGEDAEEEPEAAE